MKIGSVAVAVLLSGFAHADEVALLPGAAQTRAISGGESHEYSLLLAPGQAASVSVAQRKVDIAVSAAGSGMERQEMDIFPANEGPEVLRILAHATEPVTVTVRALRGHGPPRAGEYEIAVIDVRAATEQDRLALDAQAAFSRGKDSIATGNVVGLREAVIHLHEAADIAARAEDLQLETVALVDLAATYQRLRENAAALRAYQAVVPLFERLGFQRNVGLTLSSIGWIYDSYGEYQKSLEHYQRALEILSREPDSGSGHPTVLASIGLAYASLGDDRKAMEHYDRALAIYRATKNRRGEAILLLDIGQLHASAGDLTSALTLFTESQRLQRETSYKRREAQTLAAIARVHSVRGEHAQALPAFLEALETTRRTGDRRLEGVILDEIGELHLRSGAIDEARVRYAEALAIQRAIRDSRNSALSLYGIARAELAAGRLIEALAAIDESLAIVEAIRSAELPRELRVSFRAATADLYETQIEILMSLHEREPDGGWAARGLEASERARARALTDALQKIAAKIDGGVDERSLTQARELRAQLAEKDAIRTHYLATEGGAEPALQTAAEIEALAERLARAEEAIVGTSPRYAGVLSPRPLTTAAMQKELLDDDLALLEYAVGTKRSFVWVATNETITVATIPGRKTIEDAVRRAQAALTARNQAVEGESVAQRRQRIETADREAQAVSRSLYDMLVRPVRTTIGKRAILLVPDGPLALVPFSAMHDGSAALGAQREIVTVPSLIALATLRRAPVERELAGTVAVAADPVFRTDDARLSRASARGARGGTERGMRSVLPRLRFSRQEANAVGGVVDASERLVALDFDASRDFLRRAVDYRILHFATHAVVDSDAPERSSLVLSLVDRTGADVDGHVRLHEIYNLDLQSELVVLSACETAAGKEMRGEGLMSLTHGFLYAGARRVVATLWRIDDRATAELMTHFYRGILREGLSPAAALRAAQQELARDKRWSAPYYWAGFVLQGDPR